jgi:hypothetical protein
VELFITLSAIQSQIKREPESGSLAWAAVIICSVSAEESIIIPGSIGENGGIQKFSTTGAFPGIERTDEIVKLLCEHTAFATWTMHGIPLLPINIRRQRDYYIIYART